MNGLNEITDGDGHVVFDNNYGLPTSSNHIRILRISGNRGLFAKLAEVQDRKLIWNRKLSKVAKEINTLLKDRSAAAGILQSTRSSRNVQPEKLELPDPNQKFLTGVGRKYREKIWRCLEEKTKSTVRLVCKKFGEEIEKGGGLEVIVDEQLEGNLKFIESVEVSEACFLHLKSSYFKDHPHLFRCNWNLETVDFWMQLNPITFRQIVLDCSQTLQCIYLREMALLKKYIYAKADETSSYSFPSLTTLIVYYGYFDTALQNFKIFNSNMRYILQSFDCPRIQNLQVLPEPQVIDELIQRKKSIAPESCRWESAPLKSFISKHRKTLKKLKLVLYRTALAPEKENYMPPTNLVEYIIIFPMLENSGVKSFRSFWRVILQAQVEAQVISSQAELWGSFSSMTQSLRKNVFTFSAQTLSKIYLESYHRKPQGEAEQTYVLDLKQFARFTNLTELHLTVVELGKRSDTFQIHNLSFVPRKLTVFVVEGFQCLTEDLVYISRLSKLRRVTLKRCGSEGVYGVTFEVARTLLLHKGIQIVTFAGFNERNDTRLLYALVKKFNMGKFDTDFEVVNPRERISALDWFPCCCCMRPHGEENINIH